MRHRKNVAHKKTDVDRKRPEVDPCLLLIHSAIHTNSLLPPSILLAEPIHKGVSCSAAVILAFKMLPVVTPFDVSPPAASTSSAKGAALKAVETSEGDKT